MPRNLICTKCFMHLLRVYSANSSRPINHCHDATRWVHKVANSIWYLRFHWFKGPNEFAMNFSVHFPVYPSRKVHWSKELKRSKGEFLLIEWRGTWMKIFTAEHRWSRYVGGEYSYLFNLFFAFKSNNKSLSHEYALFSLIARLIYTSVHNAHPHYAGESARKRLEIIIKRTATVPCYWHFIT